MVDVTGLPLFDASQSNNVAPEPSVAHAQVQLAKKDKGQMRGGGGGAGGRIHWPQSAKIQKSLV